MHVPDPGVARDVAAALDAAADAVEVAGGDVVIARALNLDHWRGQAAGAYAQLSDVLVHDAQSCCDAMRATACDWRQVAHDLDHVRAKLAMIHHAQEAATLAAAVSIVQLGLDPATDLAAAGAAGGAEAALATAQRLLTDAIARLLAQLLARRSALLAVGALARFAAPRLAGAAAADLAVQEWVSGRVDPRGLLSPDVAAGAMIPDSKLNNLGRFGRGVSPVVRARGYPLGFADKADWDQTVADLEELGAAVGGQKVTVMIRGSAVSGISSKRAVPFDRNSDLDLAIIAPKALAKIMLNGRSTRNATRSGPYTIGQLGKLTVLREKWVAPPNLVRGHDLTVMVYRSVRDLLGRPGEDWMFGRANR